MRKERKKWKWDYIKKMREYRQEYIELYCKKKKNKKNPFTTTEAERFDFLEKKLEYDTILL